MWIVAGNLVSFSSSHAPFILRQRKPFLKKNQKLANFLRIFNGHVDVSRWVVSFATSVARFRICVLRLVLLVHLHGPAPLLGVSLCWSFPTQKCLFVCLLVCLFVCLFASVWSKACDRLRNLVWSKIKYMKSEMNEWIYEWVPNFLRHWIWNYEWRLDMNE